MGITTNANADVVNSIVLKAPKVGATLNPYFPFTITLDLLGGAANTANTCDEGDLSQIQFAAGLLNGSNLGLSLNPSKYAEGRNLQGWIPKIISGGIECSFQVNPTDQGYISWSSDLGLADTSWFGSLPTTYTATTSNFGEPKKLDIAWMFNGTVAHHIIQPTKKGTPTLSIEGLTRGQMIDYSASFKVVATMDSTFSVGDLSATSNFSSRDITCANSQKPNKVISNGIATYTSECQLNLVNAENYPPTLIVTPYIQMFPKAVQPEGQSVTIDTGLTGVLEFETFVESSPGSTFSNEGGTLKSNNPSKPWATPATFQLSGAACIASVIGKRCSEAGSKPLPGASVGICVNKKCTTVDVQNSGKFTYTQTVSSSSVTWTAVAFYKDKPIRNCNYIGISDGSPDYADLYSITSDSLVLPSAPAPALSATQVKANNQASFNYGVKLMGSLTSVQLARMGFLAFYLPGHKTLTPTYASDFCSKLPRVIPGLANQVGAYPNAYFIKGCASIAVKIKLK